MKKLAIYAAIGYAGYHFFNKGKAAVTAYKNIKTEVVSARNLKPGIKEFTMDVDVLVTNTGAEPINVNTSGVITLKKVLLFSANGNKIGHSTPAAITLNIDAGGQQLLKNVPTTITSSYVLEALTDLSNVKNVQAKIEIEVAGQTFTI